MKFKKNQLVYYDVGRTKIVCRIVDYCNCHIYNSTHYKYTQLFRLKDKEKITGTKNILCYSNGINDSGVFNLYAQDGGMKCRKH
jgi:hypothetical protein